MPPYHGGSGKKSYSRMTAPALHGRDFLLLARSWCSSEPGRPRPGPSLACEHNEVRTTTRCVARGVRKCKTFTSLPVRASPVPKGKPRPGEGAKFCNKGRRGVRVQYEDSSTVRPAIYGNAKRLLPEVMQSAACGTASVRRPPATRH
jgi:hypothetical protein